MKTTKFFLAACLVAGTFIACDKNDDDRQLNDVDRDFMLKTGMGNTAEVDAGTLAVNKATNNAVRAFGQSMVLEHSNAQTELKTIGNNVGFPVKDSLDAPHVEMKAILSGLSGRVFDSVYIYGQVADHQTTLNNFQNEITNGSHPDVKNFANNNIHHIQMHYQRADSIAKAYFKR